MQERLILYIQQTGDTMSDSDRKSDALVWKLQPKKTIQYVLVAKCIFSSSADQL